MFMNKHAKTRLGWIELYQEVGDAGKVCRRCGISRPTLRKWLKRYEEKGLEGLEDHNRKPFHSPSRKIFSEQERIILNLRQDRRLGVRRIQSELKRHHELSLSLATIHKVLKKHQLPYLQKKRAYRKQAKRYNCKLPGQIGGFLFATNNTRIFSVAQQMRQNPISYISSDFEIIS